MLSRFFFIAILVLLSSCSLFRTQSIHDKNIEELLTYLQGEGEGKGRLGINNQQYLFSFDAVLKENFDWILAANIPLHGEELLILSDLKKEKVQDSREELDQRIERGIAEYLRSKKQSAELAGKFLLELRRIMRFALAQRLGEKISCSDNECQMGEVVYQVEASPKQLLIKKSIDDEFEMEFAALNLTDSIFRRSNIFLHSKKASKGQPPLLSLELFWN